MNICLIFPPIWECDCPYTSLAYLSAYLKIHGYDVSVCDLNIIVQNRVFMPETIHKSARKIQTILSNDSTNPRGQNAKRALALYEMFGEDAFKNSVEQLRQNRDFESVTKAKMILEIGRYIFSAPNFPSTFNSINYLSQKGSNNTYSIIEEVNNEETNIFFEIIDEYVSEKMGEYNVVGISVASVGQLIPAFTIAKQVKLRFPEKKVVIGGAVLPYMFDAIKQTPEIFDWVDCFIFGEGETPLLLWLDFLKGNRKIEDVPNILYRYSNEVRQAKKKSLEDVNELPLPDYSGFRWEDYFFPDRILTYISSRGCPWNKCSFCGLTSNYGQHYRTRRLDLVLSDIEQLSKENHSNYFMFDDESIPENRLKKISTMLIEKNLNLRWTCLSRLDSTMNKDTFNLAYRAGLRVASYGLESGSQRLINNMKKGTSILNASEVLKNSSEAGIWNNVFMFFGFPGETIEDVDLTKQFIIENGKHIDTLGYGEFRLDGNSEVFKNPDNFDIDIVPVKKGDFGPDYSFRYRHDRKEINEAIKSFEKTIRFNIFNHENFFCIDLKRLLISLGENNKDYLYNQANGVIQKRIEKGRVLDSDFELLRIQVTDNIKYKRNLINKEIGSSYIFCNTEKGTSCELTGPVTAIIDFIDKPRTVKDIINYLCDKYKAGVNEIEPYVRQVISSLLKNEILHIVG